MSKNQFTMVSDWMVNGNIADFVKAHRDVDRLELVGYSFKVSPSSVDDRVSYPAERRR